VRRAGLLKPLRFRRFPVIPQALVLGGGVAGMSAALSLAQQGFHTYLLERGESLGGLARQLYFTLEGDDPQEFLQELASQVLSHPNVEVLTRTELAAMTGHVGQFRTLIRQRTLKGARERSLAHGVVVAATGGQFFQPLGRYLYGQDPRVLTQAELEAKIHFADPELAGLRRVVMLQCVGSREPEHPYCSRVCCSQALKTALLLKERYPRADVVILYRDLRAYGFKESFYQKAKDRGVRFLPVSPAAPPRVETARRRPLTVWVEDELLGQEVGLAADLLILSAGLGPAPDREQVARQLGLALTLDGFFQEAHQKLRPVDSLSEGVFLCGLAHYPKSLKETVAQAQAAAQRAAGILFQTELLGRELTAEISAGKCRRCLACRGVCPFGAIRVGDSGPPEVQIEVCRGCGICVAECPVGAIRTTRETEEELAAEIQAALAGE
jgi:heterodisulfide reductase subunit A